VSVKIVKNLCLWYSETARDLPWRRTRDPYRIWLSEIMLQQTQVATVVPYYERFLAEFPTVFDLARATSDRVLKLWAGLGYYSRARNLHRGARALAERLEQGRGFPANREEWLGIPGVGPYTAGALCSIVYNQPEPLVDGNVVRVLSRIHALEDPGVGKREIWKRAERLVRTRGVEPRELNQALMELGATLCRPGRPDCVRCPVRSSCRGRGDPSRYPLKTKRADVKRVLEKKWILIRSKRKRNLPDSRFEVLLFQNEPGRWREGLWDFPDASRVRVGRATLLAQFPLRYVVTRHRVEREHFLLRVGASVAVPESGGRWFALEDLPGVPAPVKKALRRIQDRDFE
jgi:A/G-specific adenine glycosylase